MHDNPRARVLRSKKNFEEHDKTVKSALEIFEPESILEASRSDGDLAGMTLLIKDNIVQRGRTASCSSKILEHYKAVYDATAITRLKNQGALLMGRANCDEFAMGSSTETSAFQLTANPWDTSCVPGGSSGGSIAAVAAGFVDCALGSETGGSVRQPAAFCGIVGLKPTYGRVSRYGLIAYGSSLDQIGIASKTVRDNARVLKVIAGLDPLDATTSTNPVPDYEQKLDGAIPQGLRIGVIDNAMNAEGNDPEMVVALNQALKRYEELGAKIVHLSLPTMDLGAAVYFIVSRAEATSNLARFDGIRYGSRPADAEDLTDVYRKTRTEGFGPEVKRRIMIGNYVLSSGYADQYYKKAKAVQHGMRLEFLKAFEQVDVLFAPVAPTGAFKFHSFDENRLLMDLQDYFTAPANLAGIPALAIPCGFVKNMPVGFQLMGADFTEDILYQVAYAYESSTTWHTMWPKGFGPK